MPFQPDNPVTKNVSVLVSPAVPEVRENQPRQLNVFHITKIQYDLEIDNPAGMTATIGWVEGYNEEGEFYEVNRREKTFEGAVVLNAITTIVTPNNTRWLEDQAAVWDVLRAAGHVPAGKIV